MKMYVVEALRYGDREKHSYVVGVYDELTKACRAAIAEEHWRSGKYECVVKEVDVNHIDERKDHMVLFECLTVGGYVEKIAKRLALSKIEESE